VGWCSLDPVWTFHRRKKHFPLPGNEQFLWFSISLPNHYTDWATPASRHCQYVRQSTIGWIVEDLEGSARTLNYPSFTLDGVTTKPPVAPSGVSRFPGENAIRCLSNTSSTCLSDVFCRISLLKKHAVKKICTIGSRASNDRTGKEVKETVVASINPLQPSSHYTRMYHQCNIHNSTFCPHSVFMCPARIWKKKRLFPYTAFTDWYYIREI
jgi:hypothetical protein